MMALPAGCSGLEHACARSCRPRDARDATQPQGVITQDFPAWCVGSSVGELVRAPLPDSPSMSASSMPFTLQQLDSKLAKIALPQKVNSTTLPLCL